MNSTRVLAAFHRRGPSTVDEIERLTGLAHQVVSARASDLKRRGVIRATGKTRLTRYGRKAQVLEVAP